MLCVSHVLRDKGFPGFQVQLLASLAGRVDVRRLRRGIERLAQAHPVICSRLEQASGSSPCWQYHGRVNELLCENTLSAPGPTAVLEEAGRLLSTASDLTRQNPLCFHVLHDPSGHDVILLQFDHVLMDNNAGILVLKEVDRLAQLDASPPATGPLEDRDWGRWHLRKLPWQRRKKALLRTVQVWRKVARSVAMLGRIAPPRPGAVQLRLATRAFSVEQTQAIQARIAQECGLPSLSMAILASAFRGVAKFTPQRFPSSFRLVAGLGLDLGLRAKQGLLCQNAASLIAAYASGEDVADHAGLIRSLSGQFRDFLVDDADVGLMQLFGILSRRPDDAQRIIEWILQLAISLWYGYFGALDLPNGTFCDVPVDEIRFFGPSWSPMGLTLLGNLSRGRLLLQVTTVPASLPETVVDEFLQFVMADLARF